MIFTHDTERALAGASALVNTLDGEQELLPDVDSLDEFVRIWGWTGERGHDISELEAVRELRPRLRRLWELDEKGIVQLVNELLREANALPQLMKHDQWDYHLHATPSQAPLVTRMAVEAAMGFVDVVRGQQLSRLRICTADDCDNVVVDLSKNRSKRYCDGGCGNRAAVAAYRARNAKTGRGTDDRTRHGRGQTSVVQYT